MELGKFLHTDFDPTQTGEYEFHFEGIEEDDIVTIYYYTESCDSTNTDGFVCHESREQFDISSVYINGANTIKYSNDLITLKVSQWMN